MCLFGGADRGLGVGDGGDVRVAQRGELDDLSVEGIDALADSDVGGLVGLDGSLGVDHRMDGWREQRVEPVRDLTACLEHGCGRDRCGQVALNGECGLVGAIGGEDALQDVDGVGGVVGVGDDTDHVFVVTVVAATYRRITPGRCSRDGEIRTPGLLLPKQAR